MSGQSLKYFVLGTASVLALLACDVGKQLEKVESKGQKTLSTRTLKSTQVVEKEFLFAGEREKVAQVLKDLGVKAQILPMAEGMYQVRHDGKLSYKKLESELASVTEFVEPNYIYENNFSMNRQEWPTDRLFFKQWGVNNIGQAAPMGLPGVRGADLNLMEAWKLNKGSKDIIVAVIDSGVDYTHPDLRGNMWVNEKEAPKNGGIPGVDDDGNGYVDDVYGYDFTSMEREGLHYGIPGDGDPMDENGHGTHCAGTIGAVSNDIGVVGVAQNVRIMAVRGLNANGSGSTADLIRGIEYATKNKVDVMSNSWGGGSGSKSARRAIRKAQEAGIVFVAAAGNDATNNDIKPAYPASYEADEYDQPLTNLISVGASDNNDNPASFTNYGHRSVDVFAPGVNIVSTYPVHLMKDRAPYRVLSGTSMATPHVSGVVALLLSHKPELRGNPKAVRDILIQTSDQKPGLVGKSISNGRVNALKALEADTSGPVEPRWISMSYNLAQSGYTEELVDIRHEIVVTGAKAIRIHFDRIQINAPYDSIYLYDKNWTLVSNVEDIDAVDYWSAIVPGEKVYVRYTNSHVKKITTSFVAESSEANCARRGAEQIIRAGDEFICAIDSQDSSREGTKYFNTFNSEGFVIDRIEYIKDRQNSEAEIVAIVEGGAK
jgi:subtilisin family serine protease